jgi:hypothetical protein
MCEMYKWMFYTYGPNKCYSLPWWQQSPFSGGHTMKYSWLLSTRSSTSHLSHCQRASHNRGPNVTHNTTFWFGGKLYQASLLPMGCININIYSSEESQVWLNTLLIFLCQIVCCEIISWQSTINGLYQYQSNVDGLGYNIANVLVAVDLGTILSI